MHARSLTAALQPARLGPPPALVTWAIALLLCCAGGCGPGQTERHLQQGAEHLANGDYALAKEHYSLALKLNPRSAAAYLGRGESHEGLDSLTFAVEDYQRALELQPDLAEARERLILLLVETGNGQQALDHFPSAQPSQLTPVLLLARGRARLQIELASEAIVDFDSLLKLEPQNVSAHYYRGLAHAKLGKLSEAEQDLTVVISLDASHASAYWQRGMIRDRRGTKELAESDRQKATEIDPQMGFAKSQFGKKLIESLTGQESDDPKLELFHKEAR